MRRYAIPIVIALGVVFAFLGVQYYLRLQAVEIFVANHDPEWCVYAPEVDCLGAVTTYSASDNGNDLPRAEGVMPPTTDVAIDTAGDVYVAHFGDVIAGGTLITDLFGDIGVYPRGAFGGGRTGVVYSKRYLDDTSALERPYGLAFDPSNNLYVADQHTGVHKFSPGAEEDDDPIVSIPSTLQTGWPQPASDTQIAYATGVAVDRSGRILVVSCNVPTCTQSGKLLIFPPDANGDMAPEVVVTIGLASPRHVALDSRDNIYITNSGELPRITVHAAGLTSDAAPIRTIESTGWTAPWGIAVDPRDQIFVSDPGSDPPSILLFAEGASGPTAPVRTIQGNNTRLKSPLGIAVQSLSTEFFAD